VISDRGAKRVGEGPAGEEKDLGPSGSRLGPKHEGLPALT